MNIQRLWSEVQGLVIVNSVALTMRA